MKLPKRYKVIVTESIVALMDNIFRSRIFPSFNVNNRISMLIIWYFVCLRNKMCCNNDWLAQQSLQDAPLKSSLESTTMNN